MYPDLISCSDLIEFNDSTTIALCGDSIININKYGEIVWCRWSGNYPRKLLQLDDSTFYTFNMDIEYLNNDTRYPLFSTKLIKYGDNGDTIISIPLSDFGDLSSFDITELKNGFAFTGYKNDSSKFVLHKLDSAGIFLSSHYYENMFPQSIETINTNNISLVLESSDRKSYSLLMMQENGQIYQRFDINIPYLRKVKYYNSNQVIAASIDTIYSLNSMGNVNWEYSIDSSRFSDILIKNSDIYIIGTKDKGYKNSLNNDGFFHCLTNTGSINWEREYGGVFPDYFNCIKSTKDNGFIIGGKSVRYYESDKAYIIKTDEFGRGPLCPTQLSIGHNDTIKQCLYSNSVIQNYSEGSSLADYYWYLNDSLLYTGRGQIVLKIDSVGIYNFKLISCGDTLTRAYVVEESPTPFFSYTIDSNTVEFNYVPDTQIETIRWSFGDGYANWDNELNPVHQYNAPGIYKVELDIFNGNCWTYPIQEINLDFISSIHEVTNNAYPLIYPNPSSDIITVNIYNEERIKYTVMNNMGQIVGQGGKFTNNLIINVSKYQKGLYILILEINNKISSRKLLIQ
jgi:hypothetical protein